MKNQFENGGDVGKEKTSEETADILRASKEAHEAFYRSEKIRSLQELELKSFKGMGFWECFKFLLAPKSFK